MLKFKTKQEKFWKDRFGDQYTLRNQISKNRIFSISKDLISNKIIIKSALEIGCNIGSNLDALQATYSDSKLYGLEINKKAFDLVKKKYNCFYGSILNLSIRKKFNLVFTSGVLIHINPEYLEVVYKKIYDLSNKYIYVNEYFSPYPAMIEYRGYKDRLFKRDFAREIWKKYPNLKLVDYGFHWKEDPLLKDNCDNSNWFLFEK
jgi:pseudaminic acid biosynthesis-associated methylase